MSRIFQTLGADPHNLGWFFILPPLAGMLVQPIVGYYSDRTWMPRLGGRRLPYLLYGTLIAVIVMILMPNSGSFGFGYASLAALVTALYFDGGNEVYAQLIPFWDGEDDVFDIESLTDDDICQLPNLKTIDGTAILMSEQVKNLCKSNRPRSTCYS